MEIQQLKNIIEAALMASGSALSVERLQLLFEEHEKPDSKLIKEALQSLAEDMEGRGIEVKEVASGFRLQVKKDVAPWVSRLWEEKPPRYTRALLETLSLIAYRQPITRGDIEDVRGVAVSSNIIRTLLDRDWVRVVGHRDVPGRPAMYATTKTFLDYFNLKNLDELPSLDEIREMDDANQKLELINAEKQASATREYDFTSEEDVEARGEEVLTETEQDILEAEKLIDQVEDNVFNKPEEEEDPDAAEQASSETAQPSFAEMAAKLDGESGNDEAAEQADSLSSVATLAEKTEQRLASDIIADHQARLRGEIVDEPEESEPQQEALPEDPATAADTELDERSSLLAEQERLMQQLMQQEAERQAQAAMSEAAMSESISSEEPEADDEPEQGASEEDDEMARMEAEAAAELAMLGEEQAERELLEAERLAREELEADSLEQEQLEKEQNEQQKPANPDSLFSD
jgi:segregation and condensation protein B